MDICLLDVGLLLNSEANLEISALVISAVPIQKPCH